VLSTAETLLPLTLVTVVVPDAGSELVARSESGEWQLRREATGAVDTIGLREAAGGAWLELQRHDRMGHLVRAFCGGPSRG
jgi:hypothetical protein